MPRRLLPHHYPGSLTVIIPPGPGPRQYQQVEFCVVSTDIGEPSLTNCFSASGWLNAFADCFQEIGVWLLVPVTATILEWLKICTALLSFQLILFFFFFGACGILVLWPGMELMQWIAQRLNHWITREASSLIPYCSSPSLPPSLFSFLLSFLLSSPSLPLSPPPLHFKGVASIIHLWSTVFLKFSNYTLENTLGQRIWYQSAHFFGWSLAENSTYKNPSKMAFNYLENTKTTNFIETTFVLLRETRAN